MVTYNEKVLAEFQNPKNVGLIQNPDAESTITSACGDSLHVTFRIENNIIKDAKFKTFGCAAAVASSSAATTLIIGRTVDEALNFTNQEVIDYLGGLPNQKLHCSMLAEKAFKEALTNFKEQKKSQSTPCYEIDLCGVKEKLPILTLPSGIGIAFFNLHGNQALTERCGKALATLLKDCDVLLTVESKGLQLTHVIARELGMEFYAVARKTKKLYMQDGIHVRYESSITTGYQQDLYLSRHDVDLLTNKKIGIVDDVISTGNSLNGLLALIKQIKGCTVTQKAFVLAEGDAKERQDIIYLNTIPLFFPKKDTCCDCK